ncbi:hypothetical protein NDA11_003372 [Ustilago hordei]|uniref:Uncharacterized protein n=1 Tax=Ustilago hordei TaxID=120017 RepID=I2G6G7_USTHO|nr:uncharacterized protein UHO2_02105 [Ustilago hordei]KAJ1585854.1 hypothetical protein NDA12_002495 [Ustilago hordei]KAJ1589645.1 hypothetical protein NDA15_007445 [Ustilago hordei]KAJ1590850.1 hypothetical protein NDA11_003372 [Ustilago hordei]KAJ1601111.1 hypothetical protein NDA14_007185 [Ustilago hordei]UTT93177.1 hypothetical protein NDA17_002522 [Ustilago hordei]
MRSPNFARAVLRTAARNSTTTTQHVLLRQLTPSLVFPSCTTSSSIPLVRLFSSTPISLKKKNRKNAFAAAEDEFLPEIEEAIEDDDLFGSVSSSSSPSTTSTTTPTSAMSKEEFARELESFSAALEWTSLDRGQFPSLHKWRYLAGHASSLSELDSILSLAKLYRDRVGALGLKSGSRFASRACAIGFPEVALNAFLNRYAVGLEYDQESLYLVQKRLAEKLNRSDREVLLRSAEIEGAPVQEGDLFRVLASEGVSEGEKDGGDGKAEAISTRHELDMPLARAQLSLIDRMSILATLSPTDPVLLSFIPTAYITTFHLTESKSVSNPLLPDIYTRTDALVSLLTSTAQTSISGSKKVEKLSSQRAARLGHILKTVLTYVAFRGQAKFKNAVDRKQLDPVKTLYTFMDRVGGKSEGKKLARKVEPLLQDYDFH